MYDVIIPARNSENFIQQSIKSVVDQTLKPNKIIIVNDNSTDDTLKLINIEKEKNNHISFHIINNNCTLGPAASRNLGIMSSNSDYIAFLDSDDWWHESKIEKQLEIFKTSRFANLGMIYCSHYFVVKNQILDDYLPSQNAILKGGLEYNLVFGNIISGSSSSVLIKKEVFKKIGLFSNEKFFIEDWDLWFRISKNYNIDFAPDKLCYIRLHDNNRTRVEQKKINYQIDNFYNELKKKKYPKFVLKRLNEKIIMQEIKTLMALKLTTQNFILFSWLFFKLLFNIIKNNQHKYSKNLLKGFVKKIISLPKND